MDIIKAKQLKWTGDSRKVVQDFPALAQREIGFELWNVQMGAEPSDFKPMPDIGKGVEEIRVWVESGTYRVIYIARLGEAVYVLHAFQKKVQRTSQKDIQLARVRLEQLLRDRR
jgi:phage-related protein